MKKFIFRKLKKNVLATAGGWTNEYTADGDVDTSIEHSKGTKITQAEAEEILAEYGWAICETCGNIFAVGGDCEDCLHENYKNKEEEI